MALSNYQVRLGPVVEAGTSVRVSVGAEIIAKPVPGGWWAAAVGIGYRTFGETYKEALDKCVEKFKEDIGKKVESGGKLPKGLKVDFRVFLFEEEG